MIQYPRYRQHRFSSFQVIIAGFAAVDLVGALLLMLPIAAQQRCVTRSMRRCLLPPLPFV